MPRKKQGFGWTKAASENLIQWFIFTVSMAFVPLIFNYFLTVLGLTSTRPDVGFMEAVAPRGELMIISAAVTGEAISDLLKRSPSKNLKLSIGGFCVLMLLMSSMCYAALQAADPNRVINKEIVLRLSTIVLYVSLMLGASCKIIGRT